MKLLYFMTIVCAFQALNYGLSAVGILPPTDFATVKLFNADGMVCMAWIVAILGWISAVLTARSLNEVAKVFDEKGI